MSVAQFSAPTTYAAQAAGAARPASPAAAEPALPRFEDQPHGDWRGCLGLAAVFRTIETTVTAGDRQFVPNEDLTWVLVRDYCRRAYHRGVPRPLPKIRKAAAAAAVLRYGMPVLDFVTAPVWAADLAPGRPPQAATVEFEAALAADRAMTAYAASAVDGRGRPLLPAWFARRDGPARNVDHDPYDGWFPVPYLSFAAADAADVGYLATGGEHPGLAAGALYRFAADCEAGLPLSAPFDCVYAGPAGPAGGHRAHVLVLPDGRRRSVRLPGVFEAAARPGAGLSAGEAFARDPSLAELTAGLSRRPPPEVRRRLHALFGPAALGLVLDAWLAGQAVPLPGDGPDDGRVLLPADAACLAVRAFPPAGLFWDFGPAEPYFDGVLEAAVFPPLRQAAPPHLRRNLPGEVRLSAWAGRPR